jgi:hypothetical protein
MRHERGGRRRFSLRPRYPRCRGHLVEGAVIPIGSADEFLLLGGNNAFRVAAAYIAGNACKRRDVDDRAALTVMCNAYSLTGSAITSTPVMR